MKLELAGAVRRSPYVTGPLGRCPACGIGKLFLGFLDIAPNCTACDQSFAFADSGDGPAVFVTLVAGGIVCALALWLDSVWAPPIWALLAALFPLTIIMCLGLLRPMKGLLLALQFANKARESRWRT